MGQHNEDDLAALSGPQYLVFGDRIAIGLPFRMTLHRISKRRLRWFEMLYLLRSKPVHPKGVKVATSQANLMELGARFEPLEQFRVLANLVAPPECVGPQ